MAKFIPLESRLQKQGYNFIVGIDEAGRGPLAGPVVSAAVILKPLTRLPKLADSKKLTPKVREGLFNQIIEKSLDFSITIVCHETIDEVNILESTRIANLHCIEALKIKPDIAIIDGKDKQIIDIPFISVIKGDDYVKSIAAASILAKVTRDRLMKHYATIYPEYEFEKHKGYATRKHVTLLKKHGQCAIHRRTFELKNP